MPALCSLPLSLVTCPQAYSIFILSHLWGVSCHLLCQYLLCSGYIIAHIFLFVHILNTPLQIYILLPAYISFFAHIFSAYTCLLSFSIPTPPFSLAYRLSPVLWPTFCNPTRATPVLNPLLHLRAPPHCPLQLLQIILHSSCPSPQLHPLPPAWLPSNIMIVENSCLSLTTASSRCQSFKYGAKRPNCPSSLKQLIPKIESNWFSSPSALHPLLIGSMKMNPCSEPSPGQTSFRSSRKLLSLLDGTWITIFRSMVNIKQPSSQLFVKWMNDIQGANFSLTNTHFHKNATVLRAHLESYISDDLAEFLASLSKNKRDCIDALKNLKECIRKITFGVRATWILYICSCPLSF